MSKLDFYYKLNENGDLEVLNDLCLENNWAVPDNNYIIPIYLAGTWWRALQKYNARSWSVTKYLGYSHAGSVNGSYNLGRESFSGNCMTMSQSGPDSYTDNIFCSTAGGLTRSFHSMSAAMQKLDI